MSDRYIIKDRWIVDTKLNKNIHSIDCYEEKSILDIMNSQDQRIAELEEQLKDSIRPKFKMGDYLYSVEKQGTQLLLAEGYVTTITQLDDNSIWYHLSAKPHEFGVRENTCYRTMEEVHKVTQKLLEEINNE